MKNTNLETPPYLIDQMLGRFDLVQFQKQFIDLCATKRSRKFERYFSKKENAFLQEIDDEFIFCNPPFDELDAWTSYCVNLNRNHNCTVVMLVPVYTDSSWWQKNIGDKLQLVDDFYFLNKRLGFYKNGKPITENRYYMPCVFVLWRAMI